METETGASDPTRVAFVTGAASGLGAAVSGLFTREGWLVAGLDRDRGVHASLALQADVTDRDAVSGAVARAATELGRIDALVSCAGVNRNTLSPFHAVREEDWDHVIAVNLTGAFLVARAVLPHLMIRGGGVVFVASVSAGAPQPGGTAYAASKAGVVALARSVALEYASHGVWANAVSPGYMDTAMAAPALSRPGLRQAIEAAIPAGDVASPSAVARVVVDLCRDGSRHLTGQDIVVDGGEGLTAFVHPGEVDRMWQRQLRHPAAPA